jgi:hypothetical protein
VFLESLQRFGVGVLRELSDPTVLALYRVAISATDHSPEIAAMLDSLGRDTVRTALIDLLAHGQSLGAIGSGDPEAMAGEYFGLLWGDLQLRLIMGVVRGPSTRVRQTQAAVALQALLRLHPVTASQAT